MNLKEAMHARHTVRKYKDIALPADIVKRLNERVQDNNQQHGLSIRLVTDNTEGIPGIVKLIMAKNVKNYFVLAGPDTPETEEKLGYASADLMLYAQTQGLNTWWIGGMYSRGNVKKAISSAADQKVIGIVVVGYGENQGKPHKSRSAEQISTWEGEKPAWFRAGVDAVLLAPTAINRQAYTITGKGSQVAMSYKEGAFSQADLGIGKYHFELGAGKENFTWEK